MMLTHTFIGDGGRKSTPSICELLKSVNIKNQLCENILNSSWSLGCNRKWVEGFWSPKDMAAIVSFYDTSFTYEMGLG